jgi:TP901 family phage tail tape measure protein
MPTNIQANLTLNTAPAQASFNSFTAAIGSAKFAQPLGRISGDAAEFTKSLSAATARVTAFGLTAGAIYKVSQAIREGAKATIEVDKQLVELNTYLGKSRNELEGFSQSLFKVAKNSAVPFEAAAEAAKEFARQGLSANEILKRTGSALTLARIAGISYAQAVNGITTAINSFNKEALTSEDITNKLIAVDTRFAVSSAQLNEALSRVGSSAEESGLSIDKLIATVTAAQQITGRGGAVIGNALKTIFTRLQRPEVLSQLEMLGVAVKDQNGYLLDGISILKNYSDATKNLSQTEKSRTAELVGGIYQINQVNALIKDLSSSNSVYADALRVSSAATDEAKKKNEELNKSLSAVLQQTKTSAQEAAAALGSSLLDPLVKLGSTVSEVLLKLVSPNSDLFGQGEDSGKKFADGLRKGAASILGKTLGAGGLPILAATGGLLAAKFAKFGVSSLKQLGRASSEMFTSEKELQIQKRINDTLRENPAIIDSVISRKMNLAQAEAEVLRLIQEQNRSLLTQSRITGRVTSTVSTAQKASRKGIGRLFAEGYIPDTGVEAAAFQLEENTARRMGAVNPKAEVVQATIQGKTGPVIVNDKEKIIPNYGGTGETAIIPNYRNLDEIPRMSKGYIPNFAWSKSNKMPKDFLIKYPQSKAAIKAGRMYSPEARAMLQKLQTGEKIDRDLLDALIERDIPIREVIAPSSVKDLPSQALIKNALDKEQAKRANKLSELPAGSEITVRQDVPSMTRKGVGVVKTESSGGFKSYDSFVAFDNPSMGKSAGLERASLNIGAGKEKSPLLKISGTLSKDQSLPKDLKNWTQVGYNPDRHSYYYDRKTKKPIVGGQQAIQIGNTVFIKEAISGNREDFSYAKGYIPNFAKQRLGGGFFGEFFGLRGSLGRKDFFDPKSNRTKTNVANEYVAAQELGQMIGAGQLNPIFKTPEIYGSLEKSIQKSSIYKKVIAGKTGKDLALDLDPYTGERQGFDKFYNLIAGRAQMQIDMGGRMKADDLVGKYDNLMFNEKSETILSKVLRRNYGKLIKSIESKDFEESEAQMDRILTSIAKKGGEINIVDTGVFGLNADLAKKRTKGLSKLGYKDEFAYGPTFLNQGYVPNFAKSKFIQNIIDSYKASLTEKDPIRFNAAQKNENYYPNVNSELKNLSASSGASLEKLAYGLAALSGNTADSAARKGIQRIANNQPYDDLVLLPENIEKVKKMLASSGSTEELMSILGKGAKTQNFAQSLLLSKNFSGFGKYKNPLNTPSVMDSWAIYVRNGGALKEKYDRGAVSEKQKSKVFSQSAGGYKYYNKLVKEYGAAAKELGVPVRELQARTWAWARTQVGSRTRNDSFASGRIPNFANPRIVGQGSNLFVSSLYDTLSGEHGGGPEYPFARPGMGAAFLNKEKTNDMIKLIKPFVESGSRVIFGAQAGRMGGDLGLIQGLAGNKMVVEALKASYPKLTSRFIQEGTSTANLTSLFDKFYKTLGPDKMREIVSPFIEPDILKFYQKNKNFGSSISRLAEFGSESLTQASSSQHSIYPAAIHGKALSRIEPVNAQKLFQTAGGLSDKETKKLFGTVRVAKLPIGFRFEKGDAASKLLGLSQGYIPNFASTFNAEKIKKMGGYVGQANKASAPGLHKILNSIGIPIELDNINKKGLTDALSSKENKLKLYNFLKQEPIEITNYPDSYSEVKDGNHRFTLAQFAGIKNIPAEYKDSFSGGYIPNFSGLSDAVSREKTALAQRGVPASQIMAHFDRGGNPIAVTNKIDEPNGLKDVPNFALPSRQLVTVLSRLGLLKGRNNLANPISAGVELFAGSAASSTLDTLAENELIDPRASTFANVAIPGAIGLKNIGKGIFGKGSKTQRGIAVASGVGQLTAGTLAGFQGGADLGNRINTKKFEQALDRSKKTFQDLTENTLELSNSLAKLDDAYRDPKADPKQILKLSASIADLLSKVKGSNPGLVSKLASETTLAGKQAILEDNAKESQRIQSVRQEALKFSSKGTILGKDAPKELDSFFRSVINSGNQDLLKQDLSKAGPANFSEVLSKGGLNVEEFSNVFKTDELKKGFLDALKLTQKLNEISSNQEAAIIDVSKPLTRKKQQTEDRREIRSSISKALEDQLPELASFAGGFSKRAGISAASDASLAIKTTQSSVSFQNSLLAQLSDKEFTKGLPSQVQAKLNAIETPGVATGRDLESIKQLPGLSKAQVAGIEKLIQFNSLQTREIQKAGTIANETKNIQLKFLALQEKLAFGGDIKTSINPQMRAESMSAGLRGPLTYQLGTLFGSRRTQVGGATDFLTETMQKYPGLLQTKNGKEPADISGVKRELTGLNAMDMQRDLLKRANMAQMMGLGQTSGLLRNKAFDSKYLFESAGLKADALFGSPEVPGEVKSSMQDYEKFGVQSAKQAKADDSELKRVEDLLVPIKQQITEQATALGQGLVSGFEASLKSTFGDKGIRADVVNLVASQVKGNASESGAAQASDGPPVKNFANPVNDAITREKMALAKRGIMGVPNFAMASINLERSPNLVTASNPQGFGVTNSIDEKNGLRSLGMRSSGFVPNYAMPSWMKMPSWMNASNLDKVRDNLDEARNMFTNADDAQSLIGNVQEGNAGGIATDLAGPALDAAKFLTKNVAKKAGLGAAGLGLDIGEYIVKPLSEKAGLTDYLADRMYNSLYAKPEKSNIAKPSDAYNSRLGNDLIDPSPEWMKKGKVPNFAKSRMEELLERIYGPRADAPKPVIPSDPAPILGVSQKTMPFYPERLVNKIYPYGNRPSMGNVNPTVKPQKMTAAQTLKANIEQGKLLKEAKKGQLAQGSISGFSSYLKRPGLQEALQLTQEEQVRIQRGMLESNRRAGNIQMAAYQNTFLAQKASEFQPGAQSGGLKMLPRGQSSRPLFSGKNRTETPAAGVFTPGQSTLFSDKNKTKTSPLGLLPKGQVTFRDQAYVPTGRAADRVRELQGETRTRIRSRSLKMQSERVTPSLKLPNKPNKNPYLDAFLAGSEKESKSILEKAIRENFKLAQQQERQAAANRYFERTAPQRAEMKAFSEAEQAKLNKRLAKEAADKIRSGQKIDLSDVVRRYGKPAFAKGRSADLRSVIENIDTINLNAGATNFKEYTPEEVNKFLSKKPTAPTSGTAPTGPVSAIKPPGSPSPATSGVLNKLKGAGKFGLKGLGIAGSVGFGIAQGLESYSSAKEGKYGQATLAGLSSAASFAGLSKGVGKVAGPAGVILGGLGDFETKDLTLAREWKDIFGRKGEEESVGIGDAIGTALGAIGSAPATVGLLGYRTGNILENKLGIGNKLGDFASGLRTTKASYEAGVRPKGGTTVNQAVQSNQLIAKKAELLAELNKYNEISGNPLVSRDFQMSASKRGQEFEETERTKELAKELEKQGKANIARIISGGNAIRDAETARLNKESSEQEEARSSKLRKSFLESFDKNAEANGYTTTRDKANYLLEQEGQYGLGSFKPTDFKDPGFAKSFEIYKTAKEAEAGREANRVIPKSAIEFRDRAIPSFPQDVLEEAARRRESAERVMQDRAGFGGGFMTADEANVRTGGLAQGRSLSEINEQATRETGFPKDVLEEAMRRRVPAEQVMKERAGGGVPNFAAMSNGMMSSGDVYSRMRSSAPRNFAPSYAQGSVPNFAAGDFTNAVTEALKTGITSAFPSGGGSSSTVSNSNVINIDGRSSIQNAPDEAMQGIISILFDKIPELKKLGPAALNFKK